MSRRFFETRIFILNYYVSKKKYLFGVIKLKVI